MLQKKYALVLVAFMITAISVKAQNFDYLVQKDTNQSYVDISDTTSITLPQIDDVYQLPIGFSFNYAGAIVDTLKIRTTGLLTFDKENKYNFIFLNKEFVYDTDSATASAILYKTETTGGVHILKIEFKNMLLIRGEEKIHLNYQVWLYQYTNKIEFHMGTVQGDLPAETCMMGLINMNNTSEAAIGYLLQGDPANPSGTSIPANGSPVELSGFPAAGTVYEFAVN
ncbi:MAG: hypothetical protein ACT4ON_04450 [Bacteroidota bacterium]